MYLYETHLHTYPVSRCAKPGADVADCLSLYKRLGYDGIFITNHFLDGNINISADTPYDERIEFYFSDYEAAKELAGSVGIKVFCGIECSFKGTDFLVYGLDKQWFLEHPECVELEKSRQLELFAENGALIIQAHPFREARYIDHIRLFPRHVHGVEIINATCSDFVNKMAEMYASSYGLLGSAGSDNHAGSMAKSLAGIATEYPLNSEQDFILALREQKTQLFTFDLNNN